MITILLTLVCIGGMFGARIIVQDSINEINYYKHEKK